MKWKSVTCGARGSRTNVFTDRGRLRRWPRSLAFTVPPWCGGRRRLRSRPSNGECKLHTCSDVERRTCLTTAPKKPLAKGLTGCTPCAMVRLMSQHERWQQSTLNAFRKAETRDEPVTARTRSVFGIPSATLEGHDHEVQVVMLPGKPTQFTCSCRDEVGAQQPPAGWCGCWHMAKVAQRLLADGVIDLDHADGFRTNQEGNAQ
jgi:hypothetical protein